MVAPVERAIMLPMLVLAGANIEFRGLPGLGWMVAIAIAARIVAKLAVGFPIGALRVSPERARSLLGLGLLSSGALSMTVGLAFAMRFPGPIGGAVLATAAAACVVGEIVGPAMLRRSLRAAGDIVDRPSPAAAAAPPAEGEATA
jgi:hypothetical protein